MSFIRQHRRQIDQTIYAVAKIDLCDINDDDREEWVLNDEGLYNLALRKGVTVE